MKKTAANQVYNLFGCCCFYQIKKLINIANSVNKIILQWMRSNAKQYRLVSQIGPTWQMVSLYRLLILLFLNEHASIPTLQTKDSLQTWLHAYILHHFEEEK